MKTKRAKTTKEYHQMAIKKSISMPRTWFDFACGRQRMLGYSTFSDYIQHLIREDVINCDTETGIPIPGLPKYLLKRSKAARTGSASK